MLDTVHPVRQKCLLLSSVCLLGFLILLAGCGNPATPTPSAVEILEQSAQTMQDLQTAHLILERTGAPAYLDPQNTYIFKRMDAYVRTPDQAKATVRVIGPAVVVEVRIVTMGEAWYETNVMTGEWGSYPGMGYNPAMFFNPRTGLAAVMRTSLSNVVLVGLEELEDFPGERLYHLAANAPGEPVSKMTNGLMGRGKLAVEMWIAPERFLLFRARIVELETDAKDPTVWTMDLDHFDEPLEIKAPIP